jgi:hypothetical protein
MAMLESAEVRWIFRGSLHRDLNRWFADGRTLVVEEREDRYLVLPGSESVGLKLRDASDSGKGKLEVKAIRGAPEIIRLAEDVVGRSDSWVKWTHSTDSAVEWVRSIIDEETTWVRMRKRRVLRKFSLDEGTPREVPILERPVEGCGVELVSISTSDGDWWTFGFEAFGSRHLMHGHLRAVALAWFEQNGLPPLAPPLALSARASMAYPAWVAGVAAP